MHTSEIPIVSNTASINILITARQYLSGVKRKTSVSAPSIMCGVFFCWPVWRMGRPGPSQGEALQRRALCSHKTWLEFWLQGRWVSLHKGRVECVLYKEGMLCVGGTRGGDRLVERCIRDVNMWGLMKTCISN